MKETNCLRLDIKECPYRTIDSFSVDVCQSTPCLKAIEDKLEQIYMAIPEDKTYSGPRP